MKWERNSGWFKRGERGNCLPADNFSNCNSKELHLIVDNSGNARLSTNSGFGGLSLNSRSLQSIIKSSMMDANFFTNGSKFSFFSFLSSLFPGNCGPPSSTKKVFLQYFHVGTINHRVFLLLRCLVLFRFRILYTILTTTSLLYHLP